MAIEEKLPELPQYAQPGDAPEELPEGAIPAEEYNPKLEEAGSLSGQLQTLGESVAHGFAGPLATGVQALAGTDFEGQRLREEANPWTHNIGEAAGLIGGLALGVGEFAGITKGAQALAQTAKLGRVGTSALRGAIEMAGLGTSDEITKAIRQDPGQTAESALAHVGLGAALGAGGGALFGKFAPKWMQEHGEAVDQHLTDFKNGMNESPLSEANNEKAYSIFDSLTKLKPNAKELQDIGVKRNWPVMEGMLSDSKMVQMAEDSLLNQPTLAGIARQDAYRKAFQGVEKDINAATGSQLPTSETEVGNTIKESLSNKLNVQYEPIKNLYAEIEPYRQAIPLTEKTTGSLSKTIGDIIEDQGLVPGSDRYNFVKTFQDGIGNIDNLQKLQNFKTEVSRSSGPLTKDLAGVINDKLNGLEERSIERFANTMKTGVAKDKIMSVLDSAKAAKSQYAGFRDTLQELGNSLGKKKIYGPQNFMDFLDNLNPQTLARRTFNENNTEFATYLAKNFPEEMATIRDYQRGLLRESSQAKGEFSPLKLIKNIQDLQPEMKKILYNPDEISVINDAEKYLKSIPGSFNPSGTSHMSAFREFFESPKTGIYANVRDQAIQAFINATSKASKGADKETSRLLQILGPKVADTINNPKAFKDAVSYAMAAIKNSRALNEEAGNIFSGKMTEVADKKSTQELDDHLRQVQDKPDQMFNVGGDIAHYMPDHGQALATSAMNAVNYLNQSRPKGIKPAPLDKEIMPSHAAVNAYQRQLMIAQNPIHIFNHIKKGTLLPSDIKTLQSVYPSYYMKMQQALMNQMTTHLSNGGKIPYKTRQSLSLFMGQPLDSTMTPMAIQSIQGTFMIKQQQQMQQAQPKQKGTSTKNLDKMTKGLMTGSQMGEFNRVKG